MLTLESTELLLLCPCRFLLWAADQTKLSPGGQGSHVLPHGPYVLVGC